MTRRSHLVAVAGSLAAVAVVTVAIELFKGFVPVLSLGVLYVFAVVLVAALWGLRYALPVAFASMLAFNWFHLPPLYTFTIADGSNWFALAAYLVVAVTVSALADRVRRRAAEAEQRGRGPGRDALARGGRAGGAAGGDPHALSRLWEVERFDRVVVPAGGNSGFSSSDLAWILTHAPGETMILKPGADA